MICFLGLDQINLDTANVVSVTSDFCTSNGSNEIESWLSQKSSKEIIFL